MADRAGETPTSPAVRTDHWTERLPAARGRLRLQADLAPVTWFRVGGPADVLFMPEDADDLSQFLKNLDPGVPVMALGVGSNLLVRDGGIEGVVIRLGRGFGTISVTDTGEVTAGAGALDVAVAKAAAAQGRQGLAFYRGIPGTIGGALRMNAGAYGTETKDVLARARAVDRSGHIHEYLVNDFAYSYRYCGLPEQLIFLDAAFLTEPGDAAQIAAQMDEITRSRQETQPIRSRTGGSTFKNPDPEQSGGRKAWQLIDAAGGRGLKIGEAQVSELHCNFLLNLGGATAADLENLGEEVRRRVRDKFGVTLEWEIRRVGQSERRLVRK